MMYGQSTDIGNIGNNTPNLRQNKKYNTRNDDQHGPHQNTWMNPGVREEYVSCWTIVHLTLKPIAQFLVKYRTLVDLILDPVKLWNENSPGKLLPMLSELDCHMGRLINWLLVNI